LPFNTVSHSGYLRHSARQSAFFSSLVAPVGTYQPVASVGSYPSVSNIFILFLSHLNPVCSIQGSVGASVGPSGFAVGAGMGAGVGDAVVMSAQLKNSSIHFGNVKVFVKPSKPKEQNKKQIPGENVQ